MQVVDIETEPCPFLHGNVDDTPTQALQIGIGSAGARLQLHLARFALHPLGRRCYCHRTYAGEARLFHQALTRLFWLP